MSRLTGFAAALILALFIALPSLPAAHEIPNDVTVQSFVKPQGQRLRFLVRVPLASMLDVEWPRRSPDVLDLSRADPFLRDAATLWLADNVSMYEGSTALAYPTVAAVRGTPAGDRSFDTYDQALAHLTTPADADGPDVMVSAGFLDVMFEYVITSENARFSIEPRFERLGLRTITLIRLLLPDGATRAFEITGNPGLIHLDPERNQVAGRFIQLGFHHILDGTEYLFFLLCLVIPFRRPRQLLSVLAALTAAYSAGLIASAFNVGPDSLWFPPLIETLIAVSIVYFAVENMIGANLGRRWTATAVFGLIYGFGLSFTLKQMQQFAGTHFLTSLLSYNLGAELGLVLVLVLLVPALNLLFRYVVAERVGTIILSALAAHTAWHWMIERFGLLRQYQFQAPELTPQFLVGVLRWTMVLVALAAAVWLVGVWRGRREEELGMRN